MRKASGKPPQTSDALHFEELPGSQDPVSPRDGSFSHGGHGSCVSHSRFPIKHMLKAVYILHLMKPSRS